MNIVESKTRVIPATPIFDQLAREAARSGRMRVFYSRKHNEVRVIHPLEKR